MMYPSAVVFGVLISCLVRCEASTNGNLSAVNHTPRITSTAVAPGLGAYILAALGQSSTYTDTTSATVTVNITSSGTATLDVSTLTPSTICYPGGGRCWSDVYYVSPTIASTGSGAAYATSCSNLVSAYNSASNSWVNKHSYKTNYTNWIGGTSWIPVTYYANATTLCDGHARVNYSPAIATSSTTIKAVGTAPSASLGTASMGWMFPVSSVSCSINPSDCDGLWQAYSTASSGYNAANATSAIDAVFPTITPSPSLPACINSSQSISNEVFSKSFYGCGLCTIFGNEVQLIYWPEPTTVSRDMCATTPSAKLTSYGNNDGTPYTGATLSEAWSGSGNPPETAVIGTHTFTSGTAYISIKKVWAQNRCSKNIGTTVSDAVLALPSDRLLSLRYSQDHFQYFATTDKVTGYPFNFADLNTPVPYSAWNGQARCEFPGAADYKCDVIYENDYNPQLAMPPGIRKLNPEWEGCQMWYGGLYDPPYALKPGTVAAAPTVTFGDRSTTRKAAVASTVTPTTATATALADHTKETQANGGSHDPTRGVEDEPTQPVATQGHNQDTRGAQTQNGAQQTRTQNNQGSNQNTNNNNNGQNTQGSQGQSGGQTSHEAQTQQGGQNSQGAESQNAGQTQQHWNPTQAGQNTQGGQNNQGTSNQNAVQNTRLPTIQGGSSGGNSKSPTKPRIYVFTAGTYTYTATKTNTIYVCGTNTLSVGGPAATLPVNCVISAGTNGLVINTQAAAVTNHASAVTAQPVVTKAVIVTIGSKIATVSGDASGVVQIGSTKLTPGGPAATLDGGSVVSAGKDGIKVGSTVVKYSTVTPAPAAPSVIVFVVGTKTVTASCPPGSTNVAVIGSVTITAGGPLQTLADGSRVSLAQGGSIVVDGTSAAGISAPTSAVVFTVNGRAVTAYQASDAASVATIDGTVISRDGPAVTLLGGETISMGTGGLVVQQGSSTVSVSAFTTVSGESDDVSTSSSGVSESGATSQGSRPSSTRTVQQNQGSQSSATATRTSGAGSIIPLSTKAGFATVALLISPLLFAIYL